MYHIISYPRSGSNFLLENLRPYVEVDKHPYMEISDGMQGTLKESYILVLRNPLDAIVSGIAHHHIKTGEPLVDFDGTLRSATNLYIKHLTSYDLSKVSVYDFNDLVSNPIGVLSTIVNIEHSLIYPGNLEGSLKHYELYKDLHNYALNHTDIFEPANKVYQSALTYKCAII